WKSSPNGTLEFWALHVESGVYNLDHFEKKPGAFQDQVEHKAYPDSASAHAAFKFLTPGFHAGKPPLLLLGSVNTKTTGEIWPTTQAWSWGWEQKFAAWMSDEVSPKFFITYGISTDCADAAYALRWIFSRINGLPAGNHLSVTSQLFTNETLLPEWEALPTAANWNEDPRFLAALDYLLRNTYTHSLMLDLYPVKISRETTLPGSIFLHLYSEETGHTELLYQVLGSNHPAPLRVLASNVPREVRELAEYGMQDWGSPPGLGKDGLLRFRWAVKSPEGFSVTDAASMPNYSLDQYDPDFSRGYDSFVNAVTHKIVPDWKPDSAGVMREKIKLLTERLTGRVKIVSDGYDFCTAAKGCPVGSSSWETWSTPSRDGAIARLVEEIYGLSGTTLCNPGCEAALSYARPNALTQIQGRNFTIGNAIDNWRQGLYKSDPNVTVPERWGF
ncbi:MAG: hypothetical protein ACXWQO_18890, partial [Bdellovibrionota bacterium]